METEETEKEETEKDKEETDTTDKEVMIKEIRWRCPCARPWGGQWAVGHRRGSRARHSRTKNPEAKTFGERREQMTFGDTKDLQSEDNAADQHIAAIFSSLPATPGLLPGLTTGRKPITADDIRFSDVTLPSAKSIGKRKEHVEMVLYPLPPGE
jgi:hypothetical protein